MCPRAAESVPVLDVKTPDCSWIVREEAVVDNLANKQYKVLKVHILLNQENLNVLVPEASFCFLLHIEGLVNICPG